MRFIHRPRVPGCAVARARRERRHRPRAARPRRRAARPAIAVRPRATLSAPARDFARADVHRDRGFTCVDCHGGDASATDKAAAKAPATKFRGKPTGTQIVAVCARCHSDAALMRKYAPRQRVDQATEYATSVHGQQLAKGDHKVATCVSCHGAHGVRLVSDAQSPVYPLNVANTCTTCHADAEPHEGLHAQRRAAADRSEGEVRRRACITRRMVERNDLSAPTCNDCHGNHGAAPPGVGAVTNVCGTCHTVFAHEVRDEHAQRRSSTAAASSATTTTTSSSPPTRCSAPTRKRSAPRATARATTVTRPPPRCAPASIS